MPGQVRQFEDCTVRLLFNISVTIHQATKGEPQQMASKRHHSSKRRSSASKEQSKIGLSAGRSKPQRSKGNGARTNGSAQPRNSFDRYTALARAAAAAGNAIDAENYYQHAEHYYRLMKQKAA